MFETLNYAELEEKRVELLTQMVGKSYDDPIFDEMRDEAAEIGIEMDRREAGAAKRLLPVVCAVNILALALILFTTGCKATAGLGRDITWVGEAGEQMLHYEAKNR